MDTEYKRTPLEEVIFNARLIEQCQTLKLITPEDRTDYFAKLNDKAHAAINALLA